jgi:hypothetical protein
MSDEGSSEPLILPTQASQLIAAARVLRDLYEDGYIDNQPGLDSMAEQIEDMLMSYAGCKKAPNLKPTGEPNRR